VNSPLVWQLVDSAFPSGGFAHSGGLEAACQAGETVSDGELRQFVVDTLWQTGHAVLPLVASAHRDVARFEALDALCDAFLTNAVTNRASRAQGRALLAAAVRIWPSEDMGRLDRAVRRGSGHLAPAFGAVSRILGIPLETAQDLALFIAGRGVLAAAVRLGIVGPYRAQRLQHEITAEARGVRERCAALTEEDLAQTAPILDVLQSAHDRLYSRLFQS
jgi:urease accessory protein